MALPTAEEDCGGFHALWDGGAGALRGWVVGVGGLVVVVVLLGFAEGGVAAVEGVAGDDVEMGLFGGEGMGC